MADAADPGTDAPGAVENAAFVLALRARGARDRRVLGAMERVPRADFAPAAHRERARRDIALPLPCGAAMTAPTTVAAMLALLRVEPGHRVLEIGTGSGYVTALLAELGATVTSLERYAGLVRAAAARLADRPGISLLQADGLAETGPGRYDRILVNGRVGVLPARWGAALEPGGRIVAGLAGAGTDRGQGGCRLIAAPGTGLEGRESGPAAHLAPLVPGRARAL